MVSVTTKVMSLNPAHYKVYLIQHYVNKFVSDLLQVNGFPPDTPVSFTNKNWLPRYNLSIAKSGILQP